MRNKIGRNVPCPCGSGKKYKRCCGAEKPKATGLNQQQTVKPPSTLMPFGEWMPMDTAFDLDELSNAVVDLLDQGRIADAEAKWEILNQRYPDQIDPLERKAMILEAKGEHGPAADYYRKAAEYTQTHDGFEPDSTQFFLDQARRLASPAV